MHPACWHAQSYVIVSIADYYLPPLSHLPPVRPDFGLSINEGQSTPRSMEIGTPGYCGTR